jgi:CheY-like chemotaxis protein
MVTIPAEPIWLEADRRRLVQVLVNLLVNAVKYTDEGGKLELRVMRESDDVVFTVRDNGIGIPAELLPRIFEPFIQEQQSENRAGGGLGIGLALVRQLIDLHGGRVQASSGGRGQGSEFTVYLPALKVDSAQPAGSKETQNLAATPARRILVVDDNRDAARSLAFLLNLHGHDVQFAHDGSAAIEMARVHAPEIILLDIGMPQMDGLEVARRLRQDPKMKDVLLVALTGYGQDRDRLRSQEAGFDVHLVKPVELEHLNVILMISATAGGKAPEASK